MTTPTHGAAESPGRLFALTVGAIGVVYGDIGTSPLYALRECFHHSHNVAITHDNVLGVLSLIVWALILIVSIKYLFIVMRADNHGEGGILALMAKAESETTHASKYRLSIVLALGLAGASLLYGDGIITPAISVLSAVEGLEVATPAFKPYVVDITVVLLVLLFFLQSRGTGTIGKAFGPVMIVWFLSMAVLGIISAVQTPSVLWAFNPWYAGKFLVDNGFNGFVVLGSVFLAVTGAEALYADMGHFGRRPIREGWYLLVFPALLLQYFGQGALLLRTPAAIEHPFFHLAPDWAQLPLIALATLATIIASQALITGAFSLSHQAVQMGLLPRLLIKQTSSQTIGQIYVPSINWALLIGTIAIVLSFQTSSRLAAAYGIAVTGTMVITSLLVYIVACKGWNWRRGVAALVVGGFLVIDVSFFAANTLKIAHGGWLPLVVGSAVYFLMVTWRRGRSIVAARLEEQSPPITPFMTELSDLLAEGKIKRVEGDAVFLTESMDQAPISLVQNVRHNRVVHERVFILWVRTTEQPHVPDEQRVTVTALGHGFFRLVAHYGFMDKPAVPDVLARCGACLVLLQDGRTEHLSIDPANATYFVSQKILVATKVPGMALWRERIFVFLVRNSQRTSQFFRIPSAQVIQVGSVIDV